MLTDDGPVRPDWSDWHRDLKFDVASAADRRSVLSLILQAPFLLQARESQRPPDGDWRTWVFLGGRGAGKTRAGAEWASFAARFGGVGRMALVGPTLSDVREVMIEGPSGLKALTRPPGEAMPVYEVTRRRLLWPNGAEAHAFSASDPDSLRGPQFEAAWCDELAAWPGDGAAWDMMQLGLRMGASPRTLATTTPRPSVLIKRLMSDPATVLTRSPTAENANNLAPGFLGAMQQSYGAGLLARQELMGELVEAQEGALWQADTLASLRAEQAPDVFDDLLVAVDPPAGAGATADRCGIIAAGRTGRDGHDGLCWILADASTRGETPAVWAARVTALAAAQGAVRIVAEANQGGEMVRHTLESAGTHLPVTLVRARVDKRARALPVSALYEAGRVRHAPGLDALEAEMATFGTTAQTGSPDRVDALVWAVWALMLDRPAFPRMRTV